MPTRIPAPGELLDHKYRLAERVGGGGMGDVYRAVNVLAGRTVAIKLLHPELVDNEELAKRFFQEAQAINRIRHPNVVDVLDAGMAELGPYIVMDLLEGESTGQILARVRRLGVEAALATAIPVLEALDAAHRAGIVHRDLKPENVFIAVDAAQRRAIVRLLDFGIAKVLDARSTSSPRTRTGVVFGTPDYLSPEQATGDRPLDGRSDLFSVGALLYELLTGAPPFRAPTAVATAFKVVHADAPTLAAAGVAADERLEAVLHKLLLKEPAKRYQTAGEVARDLARIVPSESRRQAALAKLLDLDRRLGPTSLAVSEVPPSPKSAVIPSSEARRMRAQIEASRRDGAPPGVEPTKPVPVAPSGGPGVKRSRPRVVSVAPPAAPSRPRSGTAASALAISPYAASTEVPDDEPPLRDDPDTVEPAQPRPMPARFVGRFSARGPVLRSIDRALVGAFGQAARDEALTALPGRHADDIRAGAINALMSYELEMLDACLELATLKVVHDPSRWRELGRAAVAGELQGFLKTALRPAPDLAAAVRRGVTVWQRLFSFGAWHVVAAPSGSVTIRVAELDPASRALRLWVVGVVEETLRCATGRAVAVTIASGEGDFVPELVCEVV